MADQQDAPASDWPDVSPAGLRKMAEIAAPNNGAVFRAAADEIERLSEKRAPAPNVAEPAIAGLQRCQFDDACDCCSNPQGGVFTRLSHNAEDCTEAEFYICGDCAWKAIDKFTRAAPSPEASKPVQTEARQWPNVETAMTDPLFQQARAIMGTENWFQDNALRNVINYVLGQQNEAVSGNGKSDPLTSADVIHDAGGAGQEGRPGENQRDQHRSGETGADRAHDQSAGRSDGVHGACDVSAKVATKQAEAPNYAPLTGRTHDLKTDCPVFSEVVAGRKLFEIRKDDRDFQCGDLLRLRETRLTGAEMAAGEPLIYTGQEKTVRVIGILRGPKYGLADGWVIMSIATQPPAIPAAPTVQASGEREAFEAKWPTPPGCHWTGNGYASIRYHDWAADDHAKRWEGWMARAALATQSLANEWKEAVLDQLAAVSMDAPLSEPPASILKRVIAMAVQMATDPAIATQPLEKHPDSLRCIEARNKLNAAMYGEGVLIDDLEHAVASACVKLATQTLEQVHTGPLSSRLRPGVECAPWQGWQAALQWSAQALEAVPALDAQGETNEGTHDGTKSRDGENDTSASQDQGPDTGRVSGESGPAAEQHNEHRTGQSGADREHDQRDCRGAGLHGASNLPPQVAQKPDFIYNGERGRDAEDLLDGYNHGTAFYASPVLLRIDRAIEPLTSGEIRALMAKHGIAFANINTVEALVRDVELEHGRGVANPKARAAHSPASGAVEREALTDAQLDAVMPEPKSDLVTSSAIATGGGSYGVKHREPIWTKAEVRAAMRAALATQPLEQKPVGYRLTGPYQDGHVKLHDETGAEIARYVAQPEQVAQDKLDAERWRELVRSCGETPLRPAAYNNEILPDRRLKIEFPTIVSLDAVGNVMTLAEWVDAARASGQEGEKQ